MTILRLRFGLSEGNCPRLSEKPMSYEEIGKRVGYEEIGKRVGLCAERVRGLQHLALLKLRMKVRR